MVCMYSNLSFSNSDFTLYFRLLLHTMYSPSVTSTTLVFVTLLMAPSSVQPFITFFQVIITHDVCTLRNLHNPGVGYPAGGTLFSTTIHHPHTRNHSRYHRHHDHWHYRYYHHNNHRNHRGWYFRYHWYGYNWYHYAWYRARNVWSTW